jgi:uncharacterized protein (DUF1697 family)
MPVIACLLRGINVGGHHKLPMNDLRSLCTDLGLCDARTLLQSGNIVFRTDTRGVRNLAARLEDALEDRFGFRPAVFLRTSSELRGVISRNPLPRQAQAEPNKFAVLFLAGEPDAGALDRMMRLKGEAELVECLGRELYIYLPDGFGRSKLLAGPIDRTLGTAATGRNWNTVCKLVAAAEELENSGKNRS